MEDDDERLSRVFAALADPTRRAILHRLRSGEATVAELADAFPISQPAVSRHLRVLGEAGLVTRTRRATARLSHLVLHSCPHGQASQQHSWHDRSTLRLAAQKISKREGHAIPVRPNLILSFPSPASW